MFLCSRIRCWTLALVALTPLFAWSQGTYTTNFPLTENPILENGNWINGGTTGLDKRSHNPGIRFWNTIRQHYRSRRVRRFHSSSDRDLGTETDDPGHNRGIRRLWRSRRA